MRRAAFWLGLAVLALAWAMPPLGGTAFTTRMMAHLGTVALAAPLLAIGLAGREPWLGPVPASLAELVVVWLWHVPALRALATSWPVTALEQGSFLLAGFLLWHACLGGRRSDARRAAGAFGLLLQALYRSYELWPVLHWRPVFAANGAVLWLGQLDVLVRTAILWSSPVIVAMFLAELGLALVSRFTPQLQVFFLAMPIKSALAMLVLAGYMGLLLGYAGDWTQAVFGGATQFLGSTLVGK